MNKECSQCLEIFGCNCWKKTEEELPMLGEVIEGLTPKNWIYSSLKRDYFALVEINSKLVWITPSTTDYEYNQLEITHWRNIPPDHKGRKPFIKIRKYKGHWETKILFIKVNE